MESSKNIENVLETVPAEFHEDVKRYIKKVGIAATVAEKVIPLWSEEQQTEALEQVEKNVGVFKTVLVDIFKVDETKVITDTHREFIEKVFWRFKDCFDFLTEELILKHDLSKSWWVGLNYII